MQRLFSLIFLMILSVNYLLQADIKSTSGSINFKLNEQNTATLNSTGLSIGTNNPSSQLHVNGNAVISDKLNLGSSSGSSNLNLRGSFGMSIETVTSNITIGSHSVVLIDTSLGDLELDMPYAGNVEGQVYSLKKTTSENRAIITLTGNPDCNTHALPMGQLGHVKLLSASDKWYIISRSDDISWTPSALHPTLWADASDSNNVSLTNGNVNQWLDLSGNDFHLTESTGTDQPVFNGNSISFSSSDTLTSPDMISATNTISEYRVFIVAREDTRQNNNFYTLSGLTGAPSFNNVQGHMPWSDGRIYFDLGANSGDNRLNTTGPVTGTPFLIQYVNSVQSSEHALRFNGTESSSNSTTFSYETTSPTILLGQRNFAPSTTIYEILYFGTYLDPCDAERVEGYLAWKWNLQDDLPSDHPYKSAAPLD